MDVAWNRRAISGDANPAEAVELPETAPPQVRRLPMRHIVARHLQFNTAQLQQRSYNDRTETRFAIRFTVDLSGARPRH